ncbi:MAG TPA: divalent metal cation transporter [Dinghuibacter sp.]|jgi:NRAMP (natural resistance-associated macrophage protein)-like metal ion transporter|uniref:NRAMP family divalent metal transporter n=1 Tax=Dinghuibacter sp. TaxID=2024697 RepID=UPI002C3FCC27|nr:divalent metal cation transporter [Dinghuibacter sp.]HTJ14626.1 divalent metal cation transporter [Dinghuibacter sp.]
MLGRLKKLLRIAGPGLITGASDDDPSGLATYTQAGAAFGFQMLWTALITFPLMATIQGMCARIGLVTCQGLTGTLRKHYPRWLLYTMLLVSFPAIVLNIGADIEGMAAVSHMLLPAVPVFAYSLFYALLLIYLIIRLPFHRIASILKWLCVVLFLYLLVPFIVHVRWGDVLRHTFVPEIHGGKDFLNMLVAILGTTISPYLFFWQATLEAEESNTNKGGRIMVNKQVLGDMRDDVNLGMLFSNLVMFFIILTAGAVLFPHGIHQVDTIEQAARALEPLTGPLTYIIFSVGVIGTGLLAVPVLAGSVAFMVGETFDVPQGLDKKFGEAPVFYLTLAGAVLLGLVVNFVGISPVQALIWTAVLYGLTAPVMIAVVMHIGNNKAIMGEHTNSRLSNILGGITFLFMTAAAVALLWFMF